jgi:hypothetical protein
MQANELRINNLVFVDNPKHHPGFKGVALIVTSVDKLNVGVGKYDDGEVVHIFSQKMKYIQPIPITEEWLVKMGFEKDGNNYYTHIGERFDLVVTWDTIDKCFYTELRPLEGNSLQIDCEYIHQLQNLYFTLTGKELEFVK